MIVTEDEKAVIRMTVKQEAADQPYLGKLGVAYVIINRMKQQNKTAFEVCWAKWQFSCWLEPLSAIARWLKNEPLSVDNEVTTAVNSVISGHESDPTRGATHYLNAELTKQQNGGKLPAWVEAMEYTATIGQHDFYKEKK